MSEMQDRVSAALQEKLAGVWIDLTRGQRINLSELSKVAIKAMIEAMREPTRAMEDAGISADGAVRPSCDHEVIVNPRRIWSAMIDEALK